MTQINLLNLQTPTSPDLGERQGAETPSTGGTFESLVNSSSLSRSGTGEAEEDSALKEPQESSEDESVLTSDYNVYHAAHHHLIEREAAADGEVASMHDASSSLTIAAKTDPTAKPPFSDIQAPVPDELDESAVNVVEEDVLESIATEMAEQPELPDDTTRGTIDSEGDESMLVSSGDTESSDFSQGDAQSDGHQHQRERMPESRTFTDFYLRSSDMNKISTATQSGDQASLGIPSTDVGGTAGGWSQASTWSPLPSSLPQSNSVPVVQVPMTHLVSQIPELVFAEVSTLDDGQTTQLRIQVEPADLGNLDIQVHMDSDRLHAHIVASEVTTSELLARDRTQLVQTLQDMGLDISNFDISHRHDSQFHDREQSGDFSRQSSAPVESNDSQMETAERRETDSSGAVNIIA